MRRTPSVTHVSGTLIKADFGRVWALPCSRESSPSLPLLLDGTACLFVFSVAFGVRVEASDGKQNSRWDGYLLMSRLLIWSSVSHHAFILFCCTKMVDVLCAYSTGCEMSWCSLLLELLELLGHWEWRQRAVSQLKLSDVSACFSCQRYSSMLHINSWMHDGLYM